MGAYSRVDAVAADNAAGKAGPASARPNIVRVPRDRIRLGMYIEAIEGSWLHHPFWRTRFVLVDPADLAALRDSKIEAILIDEAKGEPLHPASGRPAAGLPEPQAEPELPSTAPPPRSGATAAAAPPSGPCSAAEEMANAQELVRRSRRAVTRLLSEARLGKALHLADTAPLVEDIAASVERNASALISLVRMRSRDEHTYMHSLAVCALMVNLARELGFDPPRVREAGLAGLLHDVGKMAVPQHVLNKPGPLTAPEFELMKSHAERGWEALQKTPDMPAGALDACLHHHERFDGTGYPHGLKGEEIGLMARMCAICDVYDALTSDRPYKGAAGAAETVADMYRWQGHFDERVLAAFIRSIGIYPVGSLVRLASDRLALVVDQNHGHLTRPRLRVFYSIPARARIPFQDLDLRRNPDADQITSREDPARWGLLKWESNWVKLLLGGGAPALSGSPA